jgi:hypothetical protein
LADNDLKDAIVLGVLRSEPAIEFSRLRDLGIAALSDPDVLDYAARGNWLIVSHDVNSLTAAAFDRMAAGHMMNGLLLAHQDDPVSSTIDNLILIWSASEAEEWANQVVFLPL